MGFNEKKRIYLEWLLTPPSDREPKTKTAMATQLGVERKTLYNWEDSDEFQSALTKAKKKWGVRFESDILNRLIEIVHTGSDKDSIAASRVLLAHLTVEKDEGKQGLTPEERQAIREELEAAGFRVND